jgi:hypothetical protein
MGWFWWLCGLRHRSEAAHLLGLLLWILRRDWILVSCVCYVGSGFCYQLIIHLKESYKVCVCVCVCVCLWRIVCDLETSTMRWHGPQLVHCITHKKKVSWWFFVTGYLVKSSMIHVKTMYLLAAEWCPDCSLSVSECCISEMLIFVLHNMCIPKPYLIMKCISYIVIVFNSPPLVICNKVFWMLIFYNRAGQLQPTGRPHNLSTTRLRAATVIQVPKMKGGGELTRRLLFTNNKVR